MKTGLYLKQNKQTEVGIEQDIRNFQFKTWDSPLSRIETSYKERMF